MDEGFHISPQQRHLWALQQVEQSSPYRSQCIISIEGELNLQLLKVALESVINNHEILRTSFRTLPGMGMTIPLQVVNERRGIWATMHDLSDVIPQEQSARVEQLFQEMSHSSFNFMDGPLLYTSLVILSACKHMLFVALPALCGDAASLENLAYELSRSYKVAVDGQSQSEEVMQYADLSAWQNELLDAEDAGTGSKYWRRQLLSNLLTVKLPFEKWQMAVAEKGFEPCYFTTIFDGDTLTKIRALVQQYDSSTPVFLLMCWKVLLWHLTDQTDNVIGVACNGRKYKELKHTLGPLTKYLPFHSQVEGGSLFLEVLSQIDKKFSEMMEWQEYFSWEQIEAQKARTEQPLYFPFGFDFADQPSIYMASGITFSLPVQYSCIDRFKIKLSCIQKENSLIAEFQYNAHVLLAADVTRLAQQFVTLVKSVVSNPLTTIDMIEILDTTERQHILVDFNTTSNAMMQEECLHHLFEAQVECAPEKIALVFEDDYLTYQELNQGANQLAHFLRERGVGSEARVGICLERSLDMVIGILGVLKAGGVFVPLDPSYPQERLNFMVQDSQILTLLTHQRFLSHLLAYQAATLCLDVDWDTIAQSGKNNVESGVVGDNPAYIIYTSGSTGKPKGVVIPHHAICNHMSWMQTTYPLSVSDSFLQKTPFSFDASIWEFFAPLLVGAYLVIAQPNMHQDSAYLIRTMANYNITALQLVPSLLRLLLEDKLHTIRTCQHLKRVFCGGEELSVELQESFFAKSDANLYNLYGPTETCINTAFWACQRGWDRQRVPIGRPIANTQLYILDSRLQPLAIGVRGELYIGGYNLARGYLNRPDLTAERFIPNPFNAHPGARLYRTGDAARYLLDGTIEYLERIDHQVKIRGFRIEPGEIETLLNQYPVVYESVVVVREDTPGDKRLVAYIVLSQGQVLSLPDIRGYLEERLPEYMIPSAFILLENLPLNSNGKVDRRALPVPDPIRLALDESYVPPRTNIEEELVKIWADVLGVERIGIYDHFFRLGGHSLLATQVIARVRTTLQLELPLHSLFETPTVADFSITVAQKLAEQVDSLAVAQIL